jgi:hypothetical protein
MDGVEFWLAGIMSCPATVGFGTGSLEAGVLTLLMCLIGLLASAMRQGPVDNDTDDD